MTSAKKSAAKDQLSLHSMLIFGTVLLIVFNIIPLIGNWMAFSKYKPQGDQGFLQSLFSGEFVGFGFFKQIFNRPDFWNVLGNTVFISFVKIVLLIVFGVLLALMFNEMQHAHLKKAIQTIIFIPYFLSWTILSTILIDLLSVDGVINALITSTGHEAIPFLASNNWFTTVLFASEMWKSLGYQAIYFLAACACINPTIYEAADIDGAGKFRQCISLTIPALVPTIILMSVLNLGNIMSAGFDQIISLYNELVYDTGDVLDTLSYRVGLINPSTYQYSLGTAIGLFKSIISCIFFAIGYYIAAKKFNYRIL